MEFKERLKALMWSRAETNYRLAKTLGVHQTTVKNWKEGTIPQLAHCALLAKHYGLTVDELFEEVNG